MRVLIAIILLLPVSAFAGSSINALTKVNASTITVTGQIVFKDGSTLSSAGGYFTKTSSYVVQASDLGNGLAMSTSTAQSFRLPAITSGMIGKELFVVKLGTATLTIDAYTGDKIADSTAGGAIYNSTSQTWATITIKAAALTQWVIRSIDGDWLTR